MRHNLRKSSPAFSLIELVIVVVIIGIIGAIAIPRMSRGADGAADSALIANLSVLRNAIDLYKVEHKGKFPDNLTMNADQLTKKTDVNGNVDDGSGASGGFIYGPYLREVPPLPVGAQEGETAFIATEDTTTAAGWVYDSSTGEVTANATATDAGGTAYNTY